MKRLLAILFLLLVTTACEKEGPGPKPPVKVSRTFLLYLAMDNNLDSYADINIQGLRQGVERDGLNGGRILIYSDVRRSAPVLLEIERSKQEAKIITLKTYPEQNSASPKVMRCVLNDVKHFAPAHQYALDIGSHATGWLPGSYHIRSRSTQKFAAPLWPTRAVANDESDWTELAGLASVLKDNELEYLIFDACFMGGVESVYALRNKAKYIVASPAEILAVGMPYSQIVGDLMATEPRLDSVAHKYYDFYTDPSSGWPRSATIALYDCRRMEHLATITQQILASRMAAVEAMNTNSLQHFNSLQTAFIFDMDDFIGRLIPASDPLYTAFTGALDQAVPYKATTDRIMDRTDIETYCGMGIYVPSRVMEIGQSLNEAYYLTDWWARMTAGR